MNCLAKLFLFTFFISGCSLHPMQESTVDRESIRQVFSKNQVKLRNCYEEPLKKDKNLKGLIKLNFDVNQSGNVIKAFVDPESSLKNKEVHDCVLAKLKTWKFPPAPGDKTLNIIYPLAFQSR